MIDHMWADPVTDALNAAVHTRGGQVGDAICPATTRRRADTIGRRNMSMMEDQLWHKTATG
ncbi:hypothetical protein ACIBL8_28980 [Streptomyces sp. NPDC050523]|uniref:hypothetical protein n=1 Tax=Streptomyces sp. NPDC050523 TaxID=3365622 RepID=UPI0037B8E0D4